MKLKHKWIGIGTILAGGTIGGLTGSLFSSTNQIDTNYTSTILKQDDEITNVNRAHPNIPNKPNEANNYEYYNTGSNNIIFNDGSDWNSGSYQSRRNFDKNRWWSNIDFGKIFGTEEFDVAMYNILFDENIKDSGEIIAGRKMSSDLINFRLTNSTSKSNRCQNGILDLSNIKMKNYQLDKLKFFQLDNCTTLNLSGNQLNFLPENLFSRIVYYGTKENFKNNFKIYS